MKMSYRFNILNKEKIVREIGMMVAFNTLVAIFIKLVFHSNQSFFMVWVFSMLIGFSINGVISLSTYLIWRKQEPNRIAFLLICIAAAPVGYFLGSSIALSLYGKDIPNFLRFIQGGNSVPIVISAFLSLVAGTFFWNQSKIANLKLEQEKERARTAAIERQALQAQLQLLQAQIEPHMLFNTLANLQGLIAIDTERAQHMLEQLIRYLRATLNSARTEKTTLKHEFELMHAYLELLAIRMGKRLSYAIELPTELEAREIAPMLLQPLVENAIKHGLEPKVEGGKVTVNARVEQTVLVLTVTDTGLGLPADYDENYRGSDHQSHVGNANIRERVLALYGNAASLTLSNNQPCGVVAELRLPLTLTPS
jgi:sensor histidine kinase YesM